MQSFCEKHFLQEMKKRGNTVQVAARILPSQVLTPEQEHCVKKMCNRRPAWIVRYISEMGIKIVKKSKNNEEENEKHESE